MLYGRSQEGCTCTGGVREAVQEESGRLYRRSHGGCKVGVRVAVQEESGMVYRRLRKKRGDKEAI